MTDEALSTLANPILGGPFDPPAKHFVIGAHGPTGEVCDGRRPSEQYIPVPEAVKRQPAEQGALDFDLTGERREINPLINGLRGAVEHWRQSSYPGVTPVTRNLLLYWADEHRDNRVLYCQREAAETAIYLAEAVGRRGFDPMWLARLTEENAKLNAGLPRQALKMATGTGKTVVMAMLIAWQTINKVSSPRDPRFAKRFLVVTPSITIRGRLRVLTPGSPGNYYDLRDLVPAQYQGHLRQAQIVITNYHAFLPREAKEIKGVAKTTREILLGGRPPEDPFRETPDAVVARVLRTFASGNTRSRATEIVVFNDEGHHCYRYNPDATGGRARDEERANKEAGVWFTGLTWIAKRVGIKRVYDMSATPFFISGSGYPEGYIFPWTVSDFSLMDAIESGIVKVPRIPIDDDAADTPLVAYLRLWDIIGKELPKRQLPGGASRSWDMPPALQGALESLYRSYRKAYDYWKAELEPLGETPPVMIVVAPNTVVSKLIYEWIAGARVKLPDGAARYRPGNLDLFSNVAEGAPVARTPTVLIDSVQLESPDALSKDFVDAAASEIEAFKAEYRRVHPGADADQLDEKDLLREVMNTVGKPGLLGADVRCVVSVAMLTEGWDAGTVTHILGIRAFGSQLLCEQVVGRGLRRRSWALNPEGRLEPEYANIYGIPFAFIPAAVPVPPARPAVPAEHVYATPGREDLEIRFPRLTGYRLEMPDDDYCLDSETIRPFLVGARNVPRRTVSSGVVGLAEEDLDDAATPRPQALGYRLARRLIDHHLRTDGPGQGGSAGDTRPWLFPRLAKLCTGFVENHVEVAPGHDMSDLRFAQVQADLADYIFGYLTSQVGNRRGRLRAMLQAFDPVGSTAAVDFWTRKAVFESVRSQVSHVVLDGPKGNTWEEHLALLCETLPQVAAYAKNDHLGFTIPYVYRGQSHSYVPDFLVRLKRPEEEQFDRVLIVEVSGGGKLRHSPGPTAVKANTARNSWCAAVNNHGGFGRWGYLEVSSMDDVRGTLQRAITALYADAPIIGDPDLLDFDETRPAEASHGAQ
jgi:type III restriction enzyme